VPLPFGRDELGSARRRETLPFHLDDLRRGLAGEIGRVRVLQCVLQRRRRHGR
jgi:hypothetical protein